MYAERVSLFLPKTAIGLDQHAFKDIAFLPDNALDSLGTLQCFVCLAPVTFAVAGSVGKKSG